VTAGERKYYSGEALSEADFLAELRKEPAGVVMTNNAVPPGLLVVDNFLTPELASQIIARSANVAAEKAGILSKDEKGEIKSRIAASRTVEHFAAKTLGPDVANVARVAYLEYLARHYQVSFEWYEDPLILRYQTEGEYYAHADAYNWDDQAKRWRRVANRDYSMLVYLNDDYEGGELEFKYLNFRLKPHAGMLVAFPSDWRYAHAALPVKNGVKHSIVSFGAIKGGPRIDAPPPPNAIMV